MILSLFSVAGITIFCLLFAFEFKSRDGLRVVASALLFALVVSIITFANVGNCIANEKLDDMLLQYYCKNSNNLNSIETNNILVKRVADYNSKILDEAKNDQSKLNLLINVSHVGKNETF